MDIYKTLLLFALVCALSAFFVMWAKWEEEKVKTREERDNYQAALRIGNANAEALQTAKLALEDQTGITYQYSVLARDAHLAALYADNENARLQDRLSALLCPTNNHVWKDGRCAKCGRMQDG